jgi:hypothetical protein
MVSDIIYIVNRKTNTEGFMNNDEKELLEDYRKLIARNRQIASSNVRVMVAAQETTKRQYGLPDREPEPRQAGRREAV